MRKRQWLVFILLWALLLTLATCGKKGPPFLRESNISLRVGQLNAEVKDGVIILKGNIIDLSGKDKDTSGDLEGQVYYAGYSLGNPPCEGCPIQFRPLRGTSEETIKNGNFACRISGKKRRGIHFFKVRLIDGKGAVGPFSDGIKLIID
ncbi:MAG: hypothetical protein GY864_01490 [Desulfobacterales bacterium]|nr:hypothetical protein [Desulfobacterales bacterium]